MTEIDKKEGMEEALEPTTKQASSWSWNIFEDFSADAGLSEEISALEQKKSYDIVYYLNLVASLFKWINIIIFLFLVFSFLYIGIQKKQEAVSMPFLEPICWLFLWDTPSTDSPCSWVEHVKNIYRKDIEETKKIQFSKISSVIGGLYSLENFIYSKEVSFLLDRSKNRVKPTEILSKFDDIKNKFDPQEKSKIQCYNITINKERLLTMSCEAYSSDWDENIIWFNGTKESQGNIGGTSISIANSFINFINKNSNDFTVVNKQKIFSSESFFYSGLYTKKTLFELSLKYNDNNSSSL